MSYRVLIVDDSPAMRSFVRRVIEMSAFDVSEYLQAANGRDALDRLRTERVDIILSDVNMPVMDGEQLLEALSRDDVLRSIPLLVISTDATEQRIERLLGLGARGYVTKPFLPEDLRAQLQYILERSND